MDGCVSDLKRTGGCRSFCLFWSNFWCQELNHWHPLTLFVPITTPSIRPFKISNHLYWLTRYAYLIQPDYNYQKIGAWAPGWTWMNQKWWTTSLLKQTVITPAIGEIGWVSILFLWFSFPFQNHDLDSGRHRHAITKSKERPPRRFNDQATNILGSIAAYRTCIYHCYQSRYVIKHSISGSDVSDIEVQSLSQRPPNLSHIYPGQSHHSNTAGHGSLAQSKVQLVEKERLSLGSVSSNRTQMYAWTQV